MTKLVWLQGLKSPEAQVWHLDKHTKDGKDIPTLAVHELTDEETELSIEQLVVKYPLKSAVTT
jgi:hypothetical protein